MASCKTGTLSVFLIILLIMFIVLGVNTGAIMALLVKERARGGRHGVDSMRFLECESDVQPPPHSACAVVGAFVIHLTHRTDKESNIKTLGQCVAGLVTLEVVAANNGSEVTGSKLSQGECGCFMSHMAISDRVQSTPAYTSSANNWVLVFEDDAKGQLDDEAARGRILQALSEVPAQTPIVYLGFGMTSSLMRIGKYTYVGQAGSATHAYALRCIHAHKIVELCRNHLCAIPIDLLFAKYIPNAGFVFADVERHRIANTPYGRGLFAQELAFSSDVPPKNSNFFRTFWYNTVLRMDKLVSS